MNPRVTFITLGVSNLERSLAFYRDGLGWQTEGIIGTNIPGGAVAFFPLTNGLTLALFPREELARDAKVPASGSCAVEFSLAHNVNTKEEVDTVMAGAKNAGATITDPPHDRAWGGYAGYFQDIDGHLWEVAWHPQFKIE
ncbi:MAG: VOC family protein [Chloroflexi bacterium]|nr:VOC family protein [Chloroflexota bacterium]